MNATSVIEKAVAAAMAELARSRSKGTDPQPTAADLAYHAANLVRQGYDRRDQSAFDRIVTWFSGTRKRGLFLHGQAGAGKTHLFACTCGPDAIIPASRFVDAYRETQQYNTAFWYRTIGATDAETYCQTRVIIDDLGKEPTCVLYGQTEEVMDRVVCQRYDDWCRTGAKTHATSNLSPLELDRRYGRRITDRLRDLCVWVELKIPSQRGVG